jgi:hypothetical protein
MSDHKVLEKANSIMYNYLNVWLSTIFCGTSLKKDYD